MRKSKGFTLIELLAVIVVLAVIALIAVPIVLNLVNNARKGAFKDSVTNAFRSVDYYLAAQKFDQIPTEGISISKLDIKSNFKSGKFIQENDEIIAYYVTDGVYCAYGDVDNLKIESDCNNFDNSIIGSAAPTVVNSTDTPQAIVIETNQTDEGSGIDESTLEYGYSESSDGEYIWQNSNIITNLKAATTYYVKTRANDNAKNGLVESNYSTITIPAPVSNETCSNIGEVSGGYICSVTSYSCANSQAGYGYSQAESYVMPVNDYNITMLVKIGSTTNFRYSEDKTKLIIATSNISSSDISSFKDYTVQSYQAGTVYGIGISNCKSNPYIWKKI